MHKLFDISKKMLFKERLIAFIVDIFMIYTPILYVVTYFVLGSKEAFIDNDGAIFICFALYCLVISFMFYRKSQTLGYMYSKIILLRDDNDSISFFLSLFRVFIFCISMSLLFGFLFPFFNKNRKTFHDFLCKTKVIKA